MKNAKEKSLNMMPSWLNAEPKKCLKKNKKKLRNTDYKKYKEGEK